MAGIVFAETPFLERISVKIRLQGATLTKTLEVILEVTPEGIGHWLGEVIEIIEFRWSTLMVVGCRQSKVI